MYPLGGNKILPCVKDPDQNLPSSWLLARARPSAHQHLGMNQQRGESLIHLFTHSFIFSLSLCFCHCISNEIITIFFNKKESSLPKGPGIDHPLKRRHFSFGTKTVGIGAFETKQVFHDFLSTYHVDGFSMNFLKYLPVAKVRQQAKVDTSNS